MIVNGVKVGGGIFGSAVFAAELAGETSMFRDHWKVLNDDAAPSPSGMREADRKRLEEDLQALSKKIIKEIQRLESSNPELRAGRYNQEDRRFAGFRVVVTRDDTPQARAIQDKKQPAVEISLGLLSRHLNSTSDHMWKEKARVRREWSNRLSGEDLDNIVTERASIPIALEYKEALLFLMAHEAVHIWFDPPDTEEEAQLRQQETRADSLGLSIVSNISYIVDVRRKNEGLEATLLNWQAGSPRSIQAAVLYARSGPEHLFQVNQTIFNASSAIYRTGEARQADAAAFMRKAVYANLQTPRDSYLFYLLSRLNVGP